MGDIANMDGELHCSKGASPPNGSYAESCRDIWVQGGVLRSQPPRRRRLHVLRVRLASLPVASGVSVDHHATPFWSEPRR